MTGRGRQNFIIIEDFMQDELQLRGTALLVYAVIYSFCKLTGRFYASVAYLATRCRASERCVQYALRRLCSLGYIEAEGKHEMFDTNVYVCTYREDKCEARGEERVNGNGECEIAGCESEALREEDKRAASTELGQARGAGACVKCWGTGEEFRMPSEIYAADEPYPESTFGCYGLEGAVNLTERQYDYLSGWVGELITENYILRLESYMLEHPTFRSHSHFKTIKRWLLQDMETGE